MFLYKMYAALFQFIGWNGQAIDSCAFVATLFTVLFIINFTISMFTGVNFFWRAVRWMEKEMDR